MPEPLVLVIPMRLALAVNDLLQKADQAHAFGVCADHMVTAKDGKPYCTVCTALEQFNYAVDGGTPIYPDDDNGQDGA